MKKITNKIKDFYKKNAVKVCILITIVVAVFCAIFIMCTISLINLLIVAGFIKELIWVAVWYLITILYLIYISLTQQPIAAEEAISQTKTYNYIVYK